MRSEITWIISPKFRLMAPGTLGFIPVTSTTYTDDQGNELQTDNYRDYTVGLSLRYVLVSQDKN